MNNRDCEYIQFCEFLNRIVPFTAEEFDEIYSVCVHSKVSKNKILVELGSVCNEFYFVKRGALRVYFISEKGQEKTNHIAFENTIISAMSSFISQKPSFEVVEALEETELLVIPRTQFYRLVESSPKWERVYRIVLETAYITKIKRIENRVTLSAKERLDIVLQDNPNILNRVSNQILASYLDVTQETLSRLKSQ
ncbi:MAG: Crp/Fnr family transcriptional regulator [Bacteroidales bacterium]|jgi:CRP-like cAMP-binding protein|nr:Crp/Fnr family transcriptional regulator [Bacteroidales bacterium]